MHNLHYLIKLQEKGFPVSCDATTVEEAKQEILSVMRSGTVGRTLHGRAGGILCEEILR